MSERGDCFQNAAEFLIQKFGNGDHKAVVVHGIPTGTGGEPEGKRYPHAWVEITVGEDRVMCLDVTRGEPPIAIDRDLYYSTGKIDRKETKRYSARKLVDMLRKHGHYGPWELDSSLFEIS